MSRPERMRLGQGRSSGCIRELGETLSSVVSYSPEKQIQLLSPLCR